MKIKFRKNGIEKKVSTGISWATMFLGFFVMIIRRQWLFLLITWLTFSFSNFYFMFTINRYYAQSLINDGWIVVPEHHKDAYIHFGIISPL